MSIAKKTKEMWREIHANARERVASVEASFKGDPNLDAGPTFDAYSSIVGSILNTKELINSHKLKLKDVLWFFQYTLKEMDAFARTLRRPAFSYAKKYTNIAPLISRLEEDPGEGFYLALAKELLQKIKNDLSQESENKEKVFWFETLEKRLIHLATLASVQNNVDSQVEPSNINDLWESVLEIENIEKLAEQHPSFIALLQAYFVTEIAIVLCFQMVNLFRRTPKSMLEHFLLTESVRLYAYEVSKRLKIKHNGTN